MLIRRSSNAGLILDIGRRASLVSMIKGGGLLDKRAGNDLMARYICPAYHEGTCEGRGNVVRGSIGRAELEYERDDLSPIVRKVGILLSALV